jgi:hypothetical protein
VGSEVCDHLLRRCVTFHPHPRAPLRRRLAPPTGTGCSSQPKPCCTRSRHAGQGPLQKTCWVSIGPR